MNSQTDVLQFPEPRDVECEQAFLGCALLDNESVDRAPFLDWQHFSEPVHQVIFDAIKRMRAAGVDANPVSLRPEMASTLQVMPSGERYLMDLVSVPPSRLDPNCYAQVIFDLAKRREIVGVSKTLRDAAANVDGAYGPARIVEDASAALLSLELHRAGNDTTWGHDAAAAAVAAAWKARNAGKCAGLSFGLTSLDAVLGGAHAGDMLVLAGRPGMGKSALACNIARNVARANIGVLYISCEMTAEQLGRRLISDSSRDDGHNVPYHALRGGNIDDTMYDRCNTSLAALCDIPLMIDDRRKPELAQLVASCRRAARVMEARGVALGLIIVDHMQLVAPSREYKGNRVNEVTEISGELKAIARDLRVPVIACSQLNRDLEGRDVKDKRPTLRDLRDSGAIEQDADIVMMLFREEYYHLLKRPDRWREPESYAEWEVVYDRCKGQLDVIIAKNREGEAKTVKLECEMSVSAIRDWGRYT